MEFAPPELRLSVQRALVGSVGPGLLGICVDEERGSVRIISYIASNAPDAERDDLATAVAMIIGDLPDETAVEERTVEIADRSQPLPTTGTWVFLQRGLLTRENANPS